MIALKNLKITKMTIQKEISKLHKKLDKQIQEQRTEKECLVCGKPAQVYHHYIPKSQSTYLRYEKKNLILLCVSCHFKIHKVGDPEIIRIIQKEMGEVWCDWIQEHRNILVKRNKAYLNKLKERL